MQCQYREGSTSTVTHLGQEFLVDDLIDLTRNNNPTLLKVSDLVWILSETTVEEDRVAKADTRIPLIVLQEKSGRYIVLDGAHRLTKLQRQYSVFARCHIITEDQLVNH